MANGIDPRIFAQSASRRRFIGGGAAAAAALVLSLSLSRKFT
ncbi:twin-arginine translocation signal domain-containing protein [Candidatus Mycolicibacterium alkanivorans]|uniref:Twin-arginine translocation signal domain-containing protein n=1 Tax=Candidatus Mycolicibacterium alkanivorans TaxID=2954114 RepID=A0ABS9YWD9_9MYCO|nr:twin-arginine translocation signal domain-containing protein [Candidatus Mycolicibacterium alkanivorans]